MGVLESRREQSAVEVDDLGGGADQGAQLGLLGDGQNPSRADGDGRLDRCLARTGEDLAASVERVGALFVVRHR